MNPLKALRKLARRSLRHVRASQEAKTKAACRRAVTEAFDASPFSPYAAYTEIRYAIERVDTVSKEAADA